MNLKSIIFTYAKKSQNSQNRRRANTIFCKLYGEEWSELEENDGKKNKEGQAKRRKDPV